jgi:hypothetical protein
MRQAYQTPFAPDLLQTTQQEATEPTDVFDLTKHRSLNLSSFVAA